MSDVRFHMCDVDKRTRKNVQSGETGKQIEVNLNEVDDKAEVKEPEVDVSAARICSDGKTQSGSLQLVVLTNGDGCLAEGEEKEGLRSRRTVMRQIYNSMGGDTGN
ncbi:uncharacterized protein Z520_02420 [Fonsecaea multimorphosa CBS 102226]|uniref:Uncharacterized protein n=1 Tax=Fonsecaea multimorphosa CBS 102226 TaxID=1442371 RepID=A0A0D2IZ13_9EURO|nr:uncharacterized protein Z520_02420 [Fonsecaea multimorphosa CBS 102226]KIY02282.1 hypothetical protein Z520_02420 [Fonsecaea multimorphosa CBS 102226]